MPILIDILNGLLDIAVDGAFCAMTLKKTEPYSWEKLAKEIKEKKLELKKVYSICFPILYAKLKNKNIVFLVLTPRHGNLGDHAIALAESQLLMELRIPYYEITGDKLFTLEEHNLLKIFNGHPILINGGGFLGTLWPHDERLVRNIIQSNPKSNILLFPNTVYYEDSDCGQQEFEVSKQIYRMHKHVKLYAREKKSYDLMKKLCDQVSLAPDMAMRLREDENNQTRAGCGLYLRKDKERILTDEETSIIIAHASTLFGDHVDDNDTVLKQWIPTERRLDKLNWIFNQFRSYELVITDRLHGMIFGAITGTPTIVINSKSHKVLGCYEWIRHLDYIRSCDNLEKIPEIYHTMPHGDQCYHNSLLCPYYNTMKEDLLHIGDKKWPRIR